MKTLLTRLRWLGSVLRECVEAYIADGAPVMGAAIAFYSVLALAPLLVLVVSAAGMAFGEASARVRMEAWLYRTLDGPGAELAVQLLEDVSATGSFTLPGLFGLGLAGFYTARLFNALQHTLNHIWNIEETRTDGMKGAVKNAVRKRALSILVMLVFGLLLFISLAIETALPIIGRQLSELPGSWYLYRSLVIASSILIVGIGVALVYRLLPDVKVEWKYVWGGAMLTAGLLGLGKFLLGMYLGGAAIQTAPGAAGSVFALLLWTYYSAQVFFFGAKLTQVVARKRGDGFGGLPPSLADANDE